MATRQRGIYELLVTEALERELAELSQLREDLLPHRTPLRAADAADRIALHVSRVVERALSSLEDAERAQVGAALARRLIDLIVTDRALPDLALERPLESADVLRALRTRLPDGSTEEIAEPKIPLLDTTLLTNAPGEPRVGHQVLEEIRSADRIDAVLAFIRHSGIAPLLDALRTHCAAGRALRILTTTYTHSTEARALDALVKLGAQVKVSYDESSTRLHAKAWLFHRESGFSTAYIGSSNLTHSAQVSGLEWNVRVAKARNAPVVDKVGAVFESYWSSPDFVPYDAAEFSARTSAGASDAHNDALLAIELRPEPFQERLLEQIALARAQGHHRNLLVSATGTGKTVMAALDYARLNDVLPRARLLFVAHRAEILEKSRATFRYALRNPAFGELWVGGERPKAFEHVFASIQSLHDDVLPNIAPDQFDVVIVDEFHHAAASSYRKLLERVKPIELLGLTATPERADGDSVLTYFDGRIAAELRLWDAIDQHRLAPFAYFGINDELDLKTVPWRRGRGYDVDELSKLLTGNDVWSKLVIEQVIARAENSKRMRALGFCVSVDHAHYMAKRFSSVGIPSIAISATTPGDERRKALADLAERRVTVVFSVDLFNEGVDVPNVDTLLLLRPTESATLFLQQLGRGLRKCSGKTHCTVLDFVGEHRREFRFDLKLRALLGGTRVEVTKQVEDGFPFLPAGCHMELDAVAQERVLRSLREAIPSRWAAKVAELRSLARDGSCSLAHYLKESGLDLDDVYSGSDSWSDLKEAADLSVLTAGPKEKELRRACGRLLHVDDEVRINAWKQLLANDTAPNVDALATRDQRLLRMLLAQLLDKAVTKGTSLAEGAALVWGHAQVRAELAELLTCLSTRIQHLSAPLSTPDVPLRVHARYTRLEILAAFGIGDGAKVAPWQTGVYWAKDAKADLLAFTLDKTSGGFSPTTRYQDYAISHNLVHWESQGTTRAMSGKSGTGQRYQKHESMGTSIMLFARTNVDERSFYFLGPAKYVSHDGELPMRIMWKLEHRLPGDLFTTFAAAVA